MKVSKNIKNNTNNIFKMIGTNISIPKEIKSSYDCLVLKDQEEWRKWLNDNHYQVDGIWLTIFKKSVIGTPLKYDEALEHALCFGWIDGQRKSKDNESFMQKFTPRRQKSSWSQRNIEIAKRLDEEGKMMPSGIAEIEKAKNEGRWVE